MYNYVYYKYIIEFHATSIIFHKHFQHNMMVSIFIPSKHVVHMLVLSVTTQVRYIIP